MSHQSPCLTRLPWVAASMCLSSEWSDVPLLNCLAVYFVILLLIEAQNDSTQLWKALGAIMGKFLFHKLIPFTAMETRVNTFTQLGRCGKFIGIILRWEMMKWSLSKCNECYIVNSCLHLKSPCPLAIGEKKKSIFSFFILYPFILFIL